MPFWELCSSPWSPTSTLLRHPLTADCIDTDPPAGRGYSGQAGKPLFEIAHVHHAMWLMFTETRCKTPSTAVFITIEPANSWGVNGLLLVQIAYLERQVEEEREARRRARPSRPPRARCRRPRSPTKRRRRASAAHPFRCEESLDHLDRRRLRVPSFRL